MHKSLAIVGAGRVGRALGRRLREAGWRIGAVVTSGATTARNAVRFIGGGRACAEISGQMLTARVVLIATPDDAIAATAARIAAVAHSEGCALPGKIFLHTSGALDANVLKSLQARGAAIGSLHPLQTFSGVGVPPLDGKYFAIEGDAVAVRTARAMVASVGGKAVRLGAGKKCLYHAAAALAAGHVLAVEEAAVRMLMTAGMPRRQALRALLGLTRQVLENFERLGSRAAWTGPLARGDYRVIAAHESALRDLPAEYTGAYEALNRLAARVLAGNAKATLAQLDKMVAADL